MTRFRTTVFSDRNLLHESGRHGPPRVGETYVFPIEFLLNRTSIRKSPPGEASVTSHPTILDHVVLRGRVTVVSKETDAYFFDFGLKGFAFSNTPLGVREGDFIETEGVISAISWPRPQNWPLDVLLNLFPHREQISIYLFHVEGYGWELDESLHRQARNRLWSGSYTGLATYRFDLCRLDGTFLGETTPPRCHHDAFQSVAPNVVPGGVGRH